jgi:hypothetical protein
MTPTTTSNASSSVAVAANHEKAHAARDFLDERLFEETLARQIAGLLFRCEGERKKEKEF